MKQYLFAGIGVVALGAVTYMLYNSHHQHCRPSFTTLEKGNHLVHEKSGRYVFRDATNWKKHCSEYKHDNLRSIDFTKEMILAAYNGASPSNAVLEIKEVTEKKDNLEILVETGVKPAGTIMSLPIYPYHLVTTSSGGKKVLWIETQPPHNPNDYLVP